MQTAFPVHILASFTTYGMVCETCRRPGPEWERETVLGTCTSMKLWKNVLPFGHVRRISIILRGILEAMQS